MKGHIHSRIAKLLVVLALAVVASVMFVFVGCSSECEHANTHVESTATCTKDGVDKTICNDCGATIKTTEHKAEGHDWDEGKVVAATCAAGGYTLQTCTVCGMQQQTNLTEALPHAWKNTTTVEATCEKDGYTEQTCEACGATRRVNIVAAEGHKWEDKEVAATCGTAGRTYQECSVCGEIRNQVTIPATGAHNWEKGDTVAATCITDGYTEYECSVCHATKQDDIVNELGHDWDVETVYRQEPTCTMDGYTYNKCDRCGERDRIDLLDATGHTYEWKVTKALTCTTDGTITGTCKDCDAKVSYTADQYAALDEKQQTALKISDDIYTANGGKEAFLQAEGHYYVSFKILNDATLNDVYHDAQHKYDTPTAGDKKDDPLYLNCQSIGTIKVDGKDVDYSDYSLVCLHCNVKKDVEAHTPNVTPAHNCVAMEGDPDHAWECTLCGYKQDVEEHDYQLIDVKTGEVAAEGTAYNCLVKLACAECGALKNANEPRGPHARPSSEDPEDKVYLANCQHGEMCTICEEEVFGAKIPHNLVKVEAGTTVAGETAVASTCKVKGKDVWACSMCQELEKAGTEITWTRATSEAQSNETGNYFSKEADLLPHEWVSKTVSNNASDPNGDLCITTTWKIDTCKNCGETRIEVEEKGVLTGSEYTDEQGRYDVDPGEKDHLYVYVTDPDAYEGTGYKLPTCSTNGVLLQTCSFDGCKLLTTKEDVSLDEFAKQTLINEGNADPSEEEIAAKKAELLKDPAFHDEKLYDCGHYYCDACVPDGEKNRHSESQWTVTFEIEWLAQYANAADLELPELAPFNGYYCNTDDENMARFEAYRTAFEAEYPDYTIKYYTDANHTTEADFTVIGKDTGDNEDIPYITDSTLYVTVGVDEAIFFTGNWAWYPGAQLDVNINFNNNYIPVADIDSILFEVIDVDGGEEGAPLTLATALSTNADGSKTLENLLAAAEESSNPWLNEAGECVLTIGNFCNPNYEPVEGEEEWTFTQHESFTENSAYVAPLGNGQNALTGVTVRCTITAGDATFVVEAALVI